MGFERTDDYHRLSGSKFKASLVDTTQEIAAEMDRMGVVEDAYRERVQETHPDKPGGDDEAFRRVREAREAMLDE